MRLVGVRGVSKVFANGVEALADVSLDVEAGEFLSVVGPSGCGKSTLAAPDRGTRQPTAGTIDVGRGQGGSRLRLPGADPDAVGTALANVALPLKLRGMAKSEREARAAKALGNVGLRASSAPGRASCRAA